MWDLSFCHRRWRSPTETWDEFLLNARWKNESFKSFIRRDSQDRWKIHHPSGSKVSIRIMRLMYLSLDKWVYFGLDDKDCGKNRIFLRQHDRHPSAGILSSGRGLSAPVAPWTLLCGLVWTDSRSKQCSGKGPTKVHADPWRSLERVRLDLVGFSLSSVNGLFLKVICLSGYSIKPFTVHPSWLVCAVYSWSVYREKDRRSVTQSWGESKRAQGLNHRTFLPVPSSPKELSHKQ